MADLTWIDIVDSGVKILGGALVGGTFTFIVSKSRQNHEIKKTKYEQELNVLKEIMALIDESADDLNDYSHLSRSVSLPGGSDKAKKNSELVMSSFKSMTRAKGLAYLIAQKDLGGVLENTGESVLELYYLASDEIPSATQENVQEVLTSASEKLKTLNKSMKELRLKVSESYSQISVT